MKPRVVYFCDGFSRKRQIARDGEITLNGRAAERPSAEQHWAPLSTADRLTLAVLGVFAFFLLVALAFGTPPEIHP